MGLIKQVAGSIKSGFQQGTTDVTTGIGNAVAGAWDAGKRTATTMYDSMMYKEYFVSGDMSKGILMKRAEKVSVNGANSKGDDNIITSGSAIDIQENQCMIIVENGKIVECCTEPGRYIYDNTIAPSFFGSTTNKNNLEAIKNEAVTMFMAGGQRFNTQRVYFINTGRITEPILWGLGDIPFMQTMQGGNMTPFSIKLKGNGNIATRIGDPLAFYKELGAQMAGGNNGMYISMQSIENNLFKTAKGKINMSIQTAISKISHTHKLDYTQVMMFTTEIDELINAALANSSLGNCGFIFYDLTINVLTPTEEFESKISEMQQALIMGRDYDVMKTMARGVEAAGSNPNGAGMAMMGVGMGMGGMNMMGGLGNMNFQQGTVAQPQMYQPPVQQAQPTADSWTCSCGATNTGKFCHNCGGSKPAPTTTPTAPAGGWTCECGATNTGKFCAECGTPKPVVKKLVCDKCGWVAPEGSKPTKFCPECGDPVTEQDFQ